MRSTSMSFFSNAKKTLNPDNMMSQSTAMMPTSQNFFAERTNSILNRDPTAAASQIFDGDRLHSEDNFMGDDFESDDIMAGGRLRNTRRRGGEQKENQNRKELPKFSAIDKELLSKDISYLIRELHDEAMNFKEVSLRFIKANYWCL